MLESPDDDTGCYSLCLRESTYVRFTIVAGGDESMPRVTRHKRLRRPDVCLGFEPVPVSIGSVDKHVLLAVEKQMRRLVEQVEPVGGGPTCGARSAQ